MRVMCHTARRTVSRHGPRRGAGAFRKLTMHSFGQGKFCGLACSKRAGALARWGRRDAKQGQGDKERKILRKMEEEKRENEWTEVENGLVGERVVIFMDGGLGIPGRLEKFHWQNDAHWFVLIHERGVKLTSNKGL